MAQEKVNPRLIKSNIDLLSKIVKRPAVTEKILSRPPFRFLFDLTTMIIKTTGYLRGLYSEDEFQFETVNANKDSKMAFLDKLIDAIGFINDKIIDVKSAKIVAGVEVEKTNKFLNEFAKCVLDKKPFLDAVEKVRKGSKLNKSASSTTKTSSSTSSQKKSPIPTKSGIEKKTTQASATGKLKQSVQQQQEEDKPSKNSTTEQKIQTNLKKEETTKTSDNGSVQKKSIEDKNKIIEKSFDIPMEEKNPRKQDSLEKIINDDDDDGDDVLDQTNAENADIIYNNNVRRPSTTTKSELHRNEQIFQNANNEIDQTNNNNAVTDPVTMNDGPENFGSSSLELIDNKKEDSIMDENLPASDFIKEDDDDSEQVIYNTTSNTNDNLVHNFPQNQQKHSEQELATTKSDKMNRIQSTRAKTNKTLLSNAVEDVGENTATPGSPGEMVPSETAVDPTKRLKSSSIKSARPKSSRPAPPKVMTASRSRLSQLMEKTEQFAENISNTSSNVWIPETVDDETDEFLISSQKLQDSFLTMDSSQSSQQESDGNNKGQLVQQLLATKSELEGQIKDSNVDQTPVQMEKQMNDTNQLRNQIPSLCQSIGTLTKAMGYLHEDVGPMLEELKKWQDEFEMNSKTIAKIRSEMNNDLEPLRKELEQIERQVDDYSEQVRSTKANVFRNEQIIFKLIDSV